MNAFIEAFKTRLEYFKKDWNESEYASRRMRVTFNRFVDGMVFIFYDTEYDEDSPLAAFAIRRADWQKVLDLLPEESITYPGVTWEEFENTEEGKAE